jgi:putative ABC transport system permease protein
MPLRPLPLRSERRWLAGLLWKKSVTVEVDSEIAFHLEMRQRELIASGMAPNEARAAALARFGRVEHVADECRSLARSRDRRGRLRTVVLEAAQDGRVAVRQWFRAPQVALTCVALLSAAIALALGTAGVSAALRRPGAPSLRRPDRLVELWSRSPGGGELPLSAREYRAALAAPELSGVAAGLVREASWQDAGAPVPIALARVTPAFFGVLGVAPELGRTLTPADITGDRSAVVLGDALWRRRFQGAREALGRSVRVNGQKCQIVGVMPPGFTLPHGVDAWLAAGPQEPVASGSARDRHEVAVIARLAAGATPADFEQAWEQREGLLVSAHGWTLAAEPLTPRRRPMRLRLRLLEGAALMLWLVATAHGAMLLLARARQRRRELDLRAALGAGRGRILRQLIVESLPLAATGMVVGGLLGRLLLDLTARVTSLHVLPLGDAHLVRLVLILGALTVLVWSAVAAVVVRPGEGLGLGRRARTVAPRARGVRDLLIATQASLAMLLLVGGGLMARGLASLEARESGLDSARVYAIGFAMNSGRYSNQIRRDLVERAETELGRIPGVAAVAASSTIPWEPSPSSAPFTLASADRPAIVVPAEWRSATPALLPTLGLTLLQGRFFGPQDRDGETRVAVIDEVLARELWGTMSPIGRQLCRGALHLTVVGIVAPLHDGPLEAGRRPLLVVPYAQWPWREMNLLVKTSRGPVPAAALGSLRRLAPDLAWSAPVPLAAARERAAGGSMAATVSLVFFALAALFLAVWTVYGVTAAVAAERRGEGGLGLAMSVTRAVLRSRLLRPAVVPCVLGAALGGGLSLLVAPSFSVPLYGAEALDLPAHVAGWMLLLGSIGGASLLAAHRASRSAIDHRAAR